ncbi:Alpha/Beta hydrolase protein [Crepidotus variabilis]|uniref:Alpha/Beta hydrolase protein n=1 Tax=Crepidotus variabilis TaxID=179855 RepID=A0A9P6EG32_9AGAR|nr:Alpha/Beta hydrolase protein [Crepidotus variabilis]
MISQLLRSSTIYAIWLSSVAVAHPFRRQPSNSSLTAITTLSETEIDAFTPYTWYASTGYCQPSQVLTWSCGANCEANPSFHPLFAGGDGVNVQYWYVGYDTLLDTVIVAHQGTNPGKILPLVTDGALAMGTLDSTLFPSLPATIQVHEGFRNEQAVTAPNILMAVEDTLTQSKMTKVTIVGHSLGAAIALLDSVYLPLHIPGITFETVVYGLPRVGNQDFATYVNSNANLTHINNKEDPIPTVPGMFLGYHQPQGERHIEDNNSWVSCPGDDNSSTMCSTGDVPTIFEAKLSDHDGPYNAITMGC